MMLFIFFVFGLIVGSFLNVVIYRIESEEGGIVSGRSHCRDCNHVLAWNDNIPVLSYVFLRGECRYCKKGVSIQYPIVELATGALFFIAAQAILAQDVTGMTITIAALTALIFAAMLVVFVYDLKYMEVPMIAIYISIFLSVVILVLRFINGNIDIQGLIFYGIAGALSFLFFFSFSYFSQEKWMGYGDGFIALVLGLLLGLLGSFVAILIGVWVGAIVGIFLAILGGKTMKTAIPFGPFLIGGMYVSFMIMHFLPSAVDFLRI